MTFRVVLLPNGATKNFCEPVLKVLPDESHSAFKKRHRKLQKTIYEDTTAEVKMDVARMKEFFDPIGGIIRLKCEDTEIALLCLKEYWAWHDANKDDINEDDAKA